MMTNRLNYAKLEYHKRIEAYYSEQSPVNEPPPPLKKNKYDWTTLPVSDFITPDKVIENNTPTQHINQPRYKRGTIKKERLWWPSRRG